MRPLRSMTRATCSCRASPRVSLSSISTRLRNAYRDSAARLASVPSAINAAAPRHKLERRVIVAVHDEPQIRERILDFLALEEAQAAVDTVGHARGEQRLLDHT